MPANSDLQNKIDQLYQWLVANGSRLSPDDKDQAFDALVTLQKQSLADLLAKAPLPDITAAVKAMNTAINGINQEAKNLATVAQVVGWIASAGITNRKSAHEWRRILIAVSKGRPRSDARTSRDQLVRHRREHR